MLEIEIVENNEIEGGIEVFARAWNENGQIGFGADGTVDIERFRIFNPPVLVEDINGDIIRTPVINDDDFITHPPRFLKEDPVEATLQSLEHTIANMKNRSDSSRIVVGKRGNTTSTFYPAAGASSPVDGIVQANTSTWSASRNGSGTLANTTSDLQVGQAEYCTVCGNKYIVNRNVFLFDTASIPDTDTISSATISLYGTGTGDTTNGDDATIVDVSTASASNLVTGDFAIANWGSTEFATRKTLSTLNSSGYKDFSLNASGISNIDKTGISYFGSRAGKDLDNTTPTSRGYTLMRSADFTGTSNDPKLVVEHAAGGTSIKSINGLAQASIKSWNGVILE